MSATDSRGGEGGIMLNGRIYFPPTDGKGCPVCGAIYPGGHGGYCPNALHFDADGKEVTPEGKPKLRHYLKAKPRFEDAHLPWLFGRDGLCACGDPWPCFRAERE